MNREDFIKMYKNTKKEEIIEELFYKCTANYRLNNIIKRIKDHFVFLKMNSDGDNKEFFEDIIEMIEAMEELKEGK